MPDPQQARAGSQLAQPLLLAMAARLARLACAHAALCVLRCLWWAAGDGSPWRAGEPGPRARRCGGTGSTPPPAPAAAIRAAAGGPDPQPAAACGPSLQPLPPAPASSHDGDKAHGAGGRSASVLRAASSSSVTPAWADAAVRVAATEGGGSCAQRSASAPPQAPACSQPAAHFSSPQASGASDSGAASSIPASVASSVASSAATDGAAADADECASDAASTCTAASAGDRSSGSSARSSGPRVRFGPLPAMSNAEWLAALSEMPAAHKERLLARLRNTQRRLWFMWRQRTKRAQAGGGTGKRHSLNMEGEDADSAASPVKRQVVARAPAVAAAAAASIAAGSA